MIFRRFFLVFIWAWVCVVPAAAQDNKQPITVNGDTVEFKADGREVVAEGNVDILYQDSRLRCDKVRVFIDEKLVLAEGNVSLQREGGEAMEGEMLIYDFGLGAGTIVEPKVYFHPYYMRGGLMEKVSETQIMLSDSRFSTCDLPHPHYFMHCREVEVTPGKQLEARDVTLHFMNMPFHVPLMYFPKYIQNLTDRRPKLTIVPGHSKEFGMELYGAYRYHLNPNARGIIHMDWYQEKGWAQGIDLNYNTRIIGQGNFKYYRVDEDAPDDTKERSRMEVRHRWNPSSADTVTLEYFKQSDERFREEYFEREYEKVPAPASYFQYMRAFPNAAATFLVRPRVNNFETVLQRLPEAKLETVQQKIGNTGFYYKNTTDAVQLSHALAHVSTTTDVFRADTSNQLSYLFKLAGITVNPYAGHRDTYYSRGVSPEGSLVRGMPFAGVDLLTKLFRIYDVEVHQGGLEINRLRHIVTPQIQYRYQHEPTVLADRLFQLDETDALDARNMVTLSLENKVQTKRNDVIVDLGTLIFSSDYYLERDSTQGLGFRSFKYDLEFKPYPLWEFDSDGDYDTHEGFFRTINADLWGHFGSLSPHLGYRFKKDESSQLTAGFSCRLNPFWSASVYERFEFESGKLVEQEYRLTRDMHCWLMELIIGNSDGDGISFMIGFKLKAFPEIGVSAENTFHPPRSE